MPKLGDLKDKILKGENTSRDDTLTYLKATLAEYKEAEATVQGELDEAKEALEAKEATDDIIVLKEAVALAQTAVEDNQDANESDNLNQALGQAKANLADALEPEGSTFSAAEEKLAKATARRVEAEKALEQATELPKDKKTVMSGLSFNASYKRKYGFESEASSTINITLTLVPPPSQFLDALRTEAKEE